MSTQNLNRPAIHTERKLDSTDFDHMAGDDMDGLPGPTHAATVAGAVIFVVGAILVIVGGWHLIALAVS